MKKLKIILLFSFIIIFIYDISKLNSNIKTKYDSNTTEIEGKITYYELNDLKLKIIIQVKEKVIINHYFKNYEELNTIVKNIEIGDTIRVNGELSIPNTNTNFNLFNYRNYLLSKKINWQLSSENIKLINKNKNILYKIKNNLISRIESFKDTSKIYLKLFILGDNGLDDEINDSYKINGISHLFAISGMHISLLSVILLNLLKFINKKDNINYLIVILFLIFYMFLTNYSPSVIRASLLFSFTSLTKIFNLKIKSIYILLFIFIILFTYNPFYIYNTGFIFSFLISASLIINNKLFKKYNNYFIQIFMVSLISFLVSIPVQINNYFEINLLSPFINIIFVPLISVVIFPFTLIVCIFKPLENILLILINILELLSLFLSKIKCFNIILCKMNIYIFVLYYLIIIFIIYKLHHNKKKYILLILLMFLIHTNINNFNNNSYLTMIDVGQGDSILISLKNNQGNILFDTGGLVSFDNKPKYILAKQILIPYLKSQGIKKLDYLVLTHGDADHALETIELLKSFKINNVLLNSGKNNNIEKSIINYMDQNKINYLKISDYTFKIKNNIFRFINDKDITNENEDTLIAFITIVSKNILLMGDAGIESENYILNKYKLPKMDILKVGHHGSKHSSGDIFLNTIKPKYSLISSGKNNRFNHPHNETINRLNAIDTIIFNTSINGMVKVKLNDSIQIYTCNKAATQ